MKTFTRWLPAQYTACPSPRAAVVTRRRHVTCHVTCHVTPASRRCVCAGPRRGRPVRCRIARRSRSGQGPGGTRRTTTGPRRKCHRPIRHSGMPVQVLDAGINVTIACPACPAVHRAGRTGRTGRGHTLGHTHTPRASLFSPSRGEGRVPFFVNFSSGRTRIAFAFP